VARQSQIIAAPDTSERDHRGGRKCGTCWWLKTGRADYYGPRYWCAYVPPPINREWGKHVDPVDPEKTWCSQWVWDPSSE
jgi:hypothetical protein